MAKRPEITIFNAQVNIPAGCKGSARIEHIEVSAAQSRFTAFRTAAGHPEEYVAPGKYTRLFVDGDTMMSDTDAERRSNMRVTDNAHGSVLIAGLGIGLILLPLLGSKTVTSITVIEKSRDVVDLVAPHLPRRRLCIITADIFAWRPGPRQRFNTIYFDIWPTISSENLEQINCLHRIFGKYLDRSDPKAWMGSWMEEGLRVKRRQERASGLYWRTQAEE